MAFDPIRTERLVIRGMTADDAEALWERRNDPQVSKYQNWEHPYPREDAERIARSVGESDDLAEDGWWMGVVENAATGEEVGDLAVHLEWQRRSAEIGYNFLPKHWGKGYAVEACTALVEYLFDGIGVTRVFGMLHPENRASAQVLERLGMVFEGHTRSSYWDGDEVSDDWIYGMLVEDRDAWRDRPRGRPSAVRLSEITWNEFDEIYALRTHKTQQSFVAPNPKSIAEAFVSTTAPENYTAWPRGIYADDEPAGFVMVAMPLESNEDKEPFLWRLLIDRMHQRRGIASMALALVEDEMRSLGHTAWKTSWIPGRGSPEPFYLGLGFEPTGEMEGDEIVGRKVL
jgi:RimJ/RimL family protein N-acetyltransferase